VTRVLLALSTMLALTLPATAAAHGGGSGHGYVSSVERIVDAGGIEATASGDGHFTFTAPTGRTVVVAGYDDEPYLRFRDGRVEVNDLAPTAYVNDERSPPSRADENAAPVWREVARGRTYTWHDHRTHWMEADPPAAVRSDTKSHHHISDWQVTGTVDGRPFAVEGSLEWEPTESGPGLEWISYLAIGGGVLYAAFLLLVQRRRPGAERRRRADARG
jgi:hypothetical protein